MVYIRSNMTLLQVFEKHGLLNGRNILAEEVMLKSATGEKRTPKEMAQAILMDAINCKLEFWKEQNWTDGATERENELVSDQLKKIADRLAKSLGYKEATLV
jgi:hypothetical protein